MEIIHPESLTAFVDGTTEFLTRYEAEHGLMLGIARATPSPPPDAYFALVTDRGAVAAAAMRLDWRLILSRNGTQGAIELLTADADSPLVRMVLGPAESVRRFRNASSRAWRDFMAQGVYECRAVRRPTPVTGRRRLATTADRVLLARWLGDFSAEALNEPVDEAAALARVGGHIEGQHYHLWETDGEAVSVAAAVAPTPHGIRVNNVYTPPEQRGRGYASALVASVTEHLLDSGYDFTFLHTDLSNPTSNEIYMRIGYRHVATFEAVRL